MHDLRRSLASWMANTGANAPLIQSAMNHEDMKTTMSIYVHTVKGAERDAREKAQRFMLSHKENRQPEQWHHSLCASGVGNSDKLGRRQAL